MSGTEGGGRKFVKEKGSLPPELLNLLLLLWNGSVWGDVEENVVTSVEE